MAGIREELQLVDKFSAVFNKFTQAAQRAAANCDDVKAAIDAANASPLDRLLTSTETLAANMQLLVEKLDQVETAQNNVTEATNRTASASTNWLSVIKRAATALGAVKLAQSFIETADTMSQITAKFGLITSDESEAAALQCPYPTVQPGTVRFSSAPAAADPAPFSAGCPPWQKEHRRVYAA